MNREVMFEDFRGEWLKEIDDVLEARGGWPLVGNPKARSRSSSILSPRNREGDPKDPHVRIAVVTARNRPAHERMIRTLRHWGVQVNSAFFMGGVPKNDVLTAFRTHIFFDDQDVHLASSSVPAARVPYRTEPELQTEDPSRSGRLR